MMEWIHPDMAWIGAYLPNDPAGSGWDDDTDGAPPSASLHTTPPEGDGGIPLSPEDPADLLRFAEELRAAARDLLRDALARASVK